MAQKNFTLSQLTTAINELYVVKGKLFPGSTLATGLTTFFDWIGFAPLSHWLLTLAGLSVTHQNTYSSEARAAVDESIIRLQQAKIFLLENPSFSYASIAHDTRELILGSETLTLPINFRVYAYCDGNGNCIY